MVTRSGPMETFWPTLLPILVEYIAPVLGTILLGLLSWVADAARQYFNDVKADRLLDRLERTANIVVHDVEQTVIPQLTRDAADGCITPDEVKSLQVTASNKVKKLMGTKRMQQLKKDAGEDLDDIITHVIESKVREMRGQRRLKS